MKDPTIFPHTGQRRARQLLHGHVRVRPHEATDARLIGERKHLLAARVLHKTLVGRRVARRVSVQHGRRNVDLGARDRVERERVD